MIDLHKLVRCFVIVVNLHILATFSWGTEIKSEGNGNIPTYILVTCHLTIDFHVSCWILCNCYQSCNVFLRYRNKMCRQDLVGYLVIVFKCFRPCDISWGTEIKSDANGNIIAYILVTCHLMIDFHVSYWIIINCLQNYHPFNTLLRCRN